MKRNFYFIVLLLLQIAISTPVQSANPDDGDNFYVFTGGNKNMSVYPLDNLDKITFGEKVMSVWVNNSPTDYNYSDISMMTFSENVMQPLGVEQLSSGNFDVSVNYYSSSQILQIKCNHLVSGFVIYDSLGKPVMVNKMKSNSYRISLDVLPSGIYIVNVFDKDLSKNMKIVK